MIDLGPAPFAISEEDLLGKHRTTLERMIKDELEDDVETERLTQVACALRNILYWKSKQYVVPRYDHHTRTIEFTEAIDRDGKVKFNSVYNIFESDGVKFIGAVSPRAPNAKALPDDDESEQDIAIAKDVDGALRMFRRKWDANRLQKELAYHAWTTGPTFGLTTYNADGHKYGWTEEPQIEISEEPVGPFGETMPVPKEVGSKKYPKGDVEIALFNVLYVTVPFKSKTLKDADWLRCEFMEHKGVLKGLHPKLNDDEFDRHSGSSISAEEAIRAQHQEVAPSGSPGEDWSKSRWHYARYWLRPSMYTLIKGSVMSDEGESIRLYEALTDQFPDGLKLTVVNGRLVAVDHERIDDVWSVCKTGKGDRILSDPWGNNSIPIQDDTNDLMNMAKEIILRHITKTLVDTSLISKENIEGNEAEIAEIILTKIPSGVNINNLMGQIPNAKMPDSLMQFATFQQAMRREISQVNEALSGGGQPSNTYRGEKMRRDQSMMAFAPFFDETQSFWEKAYTNGIKQYGKYATGPVKVPGEEGKGATWVNPAMISENGWHIEAEEGLPMSHAEEVDRFLFLLNENNPEAIQALGLLSPINSAQIYKMLGLRGFKAPEELARQKAQNDIQRLLNEAPIPDIDPMTGQQMGEMSSVPPDEYDDPVLFQQIYTDWLLASESDREKNPEGFQNVLARWREYKMKAEAMMMPPPGELPPGAEGEPPPMEEPMQPPPPGPPPFDTSPEML